MYVYRAKIQFKLNNISKHRQRATAKLLGIGLYDFENVTVQLTVEKSFIAFTIFRRDRLVDFLPFRVSYGRIVNSSICLRLIFVVVVVAILRSYEY